MHGWLVCLCLNGLRVASHPRWANQSDSLSYEFASEIHCCYPTSADYMYLDAQEEAEMRGQASLERQSERSCLG